APALLEVPGRIHPLDLRWATPPRGAEPLGVSPATGGVVVRREFLGHVARTITRTLSTTSGDVLVFLPGAREVDQVRRLLTHQADTLDVEILSLHGSLPAAEQDRVLSGPGPRRRVVLSTAVAESSLTVPGVRVVVDACLSREPRTDVARGIPMLVTVQASRARCEQRAGRAARLGPGPALRCTSEADWARRPAQSLPEIATADLTDALLQCAVWGNPGMSGLSLLDRPPAGSLAAAGQRLASLGAVDEGGRATSLGRQLAALPLDPPLARALVDATPQLGARRAAGFVALLGEDLRAPGADLASLARSLGRGGGDPMLRHRVHDQQQRLSRLLQSGASSTKGPRASGHHLSDEDALALVVALAHPGWIARRRPGTDRYLLADGLGATLPPGSPLTGQEWLAIAQIQRGAGRADGIIHAAVPLAREDAERAGAALVHEETRAQLRAGRVQAHSVTSLGAIDLTERALQQVPEEVGAQVLGDALRREGLDLLPWPAAARSLRERMAVLHEALGEPWPDVSEEALAAQLDRWLGADLGRLARGGALSRVDTLSGLRALLPWPEAAHLEELAPERLEVPTGQHRSVDWSSGRPILSLRVQEAFGWVDTPRVADGRVPVLLHLLDPAGRPVAVTSDLASFWAGPYHDVRAQLRGRYPRHPWPEDPLHAEPTSRAKPRPRRPGH
ncbi:MAG: ATP-dependent helicase HrpB, partial [Propionibacterium sp.]|nr:ATP-dependent helicase HrpB [Propionibacterium sp.]